ARRPLAIRSTARVVLLRYGVIGAVELPRRVHCRLPCCHASAGFSSAGNTCEGDASRSRPAAKGTESERKLSDSGAETVRRLGVARADQASACRSAPGLGGDQLEVAVAVVRHVGVRGLRLVPLEVDELRR